MARERERRKSLERQTVPSPRRRCPQLGLVVFRTRFCDRGQPLPFISTMDAAVVGQWVGERARETCGAKMSLASGRRADCWSLVWSRVSDAGGQLEQ